MLRRLRLSASFVCLVGCAALTLLSLRSFYRHDMLTCGRVWRQYVAVVGSMQGRVTMYAYESGTSRWDFETYIVDKRQESQVQGVRQAEIPYGFGVVKSAGRLFVTAPYWFPVLMLGLLFTLLRFRRPWRYNIRSLLIVTTFVAAVLGMAVALTK